MTVWIDPANGLMWSGRDNGKNINWIDAQKYCMNLTLARYSGWRLPTIEELRALYDRSASREYIYHGETYSGVVDGQKMENFIKHGVELNSCCAWSGTRMGDTYALYYRFQAGEAKYFDIRLSGLVRALCVREVSPAIPANKE